MSKPKTLFYVEIIPGGRQLGYRERGGKTYAQRAHAVTHRDRLIASGVEAVLFECTPEWQQSIL